MTNGGLVLRGEAKYKEDFLSDYIQKNSIPSYNIFRFSDSLKIAESRQIKNILSRKTQDDAQRLFIIEKDPSIEAQNALLKTIEEIDGNSLIVFMQDQNLLSTIFSRCKVVDVERSESSPSEVLSTKFATFLENVSASPSLYDAFIFSESLTDENINIEDLIVVVRKILINSYLNRDNKSKVALRILKELIYYYPLTVNNNLNKRTVFERIFLQ